MRPVRAAADEAVADIELAQARVKGGVVENAAVEHCDGDAAPPGRIDGPHAKSGEKVIADRHGEPGAAGFDGWGGWREDGVGSDCGIVGGVGGELAGEGGVVGDSNARGIKDVNTADDLDSGGAGAGEEALQSGGVAEGEQALVEPDV